MNLVCHKRAEVFLEKVRKQQKLDEKARKAAEKKLLRKSLKLNVKIEKIPEQEYPNEGVHTSASKIESELGSTNGQTLESGGEPDLIRINSGMVMSNVTGLGHSVVFDNNLDANTKANQLGLDLTALGQENVGTEGASEFQISKNFERSEIEDENSTHWSTNDSAIEIMKSFKTKVDNWLSGKMNFKGKVKINEARVSPYEVEETTDKISVKIPEEPDEIIEKPDNELDIVSQSTKRRRMEAREKQRRAKMPWYMVIKEVFWSVVGVQENKETLLERRKREEEAQKKVNIVFAVLYA